MVPSRLLALCRVLLAFLVVAVATPRAVSALQAPPNAERLLRTMSPNEIRARIRASGLSDDEIRARLRAAGYDPSLADPYLDSGAGARGATPLGGEDALLTALEQAGVSLRRSGPLDARIDLLPDTLLVEDDEEEPDTALQVFGADVFRQRSNQFAASPLASLGRSYPLGPGDQITLILTGDVQEAYNLDVTRDGQIVIPQVGQISVAGMTLAALESRLYDLLGRAYSGVRRGPEATTFFSVSLSEIRTIQVYVVGEVRRPGAYMVSAVGTVLEALYLAGGPRESGSFRQVVLRRGGEVEAVMDLYPYLTAGETRSALRLQEGDVVFVPPVGGQVSVTGEVIRPAFYEVVEGEGLVDVLDHAGGLKPTARFDVVRVERILPWHERGPGRDRRIVDVNLGALLTRGDTVELLPGDAVKVFPVLTDSRDWVEIEGAVYRPGRYELLPGATVATLIDQAGGPLPDVLDPVVHVSSLDLTDGTRRLTRVPLSAAPSTPLLEFDRVRLFGRDALLVPDSIGVYGLVQSPGRYPLSVGASAEDAILAAGGLAFGADPRQAELIRIVSTSPDGVRITSSSRVRLSDDLPYPGPAAPGALPEAPVSGLPAATTVPLEPGDEVYVRQVPQYRTPRRVQVTGEVLAPGTYVLERIDERVSSILRRAGGLTAQAFPEGFQLIRDSTTVGVDLNDALQRPGGPSDPVLVEGDSLVVPIYDATVLVTGAVEFDTRVVVRPGMDLGDVISEAGGLTPEADEGRISVRYANGTRRTVKRFLGWNYSSPEIRPGSTVFVPTKAQSEGGFDWNTALSRVLAVGSTMATIIIAVKQ